MKNIITSVVIVFLSIRIGFSQGFVNLDFEQANLSGYGSGSVPATNAFPGWSVIASYLLYDDTSLSGGSISIMDVAGIAGPLIQRKYFVFFRNASSLSVSIGQTGQIPSSAQSIIYWGQTPLPGDPVGIQVTFNAQPLDFVETGSTANYNIYQANISAFAGQSGELLFTAPPNGIGSLDNIQFSSSPVPEPSELALAALGTLLLGSRRWKSR